MKLMQLEDNDSKEVKAKKILEKLLNTSISSKEFEALIQKCGNIVYSVNENTAKHTLNVFKSVLEDYRKHSK